MDPEAAHIVLTDFKTQIFVVSWELTLEQAVDMVSISHGLGGALTGLWYTGMLKGFRVRFWHFGISMGGFPFQTQCTQFATLGAFWKVCPESTQFVQNWVDLFCLFGFLV